MSQQYYLLADIGGTNIRCALMPSNDKKFAQSLLKRIDPFDCERTYLWADVPTLDIAIHQFLCDLNVDIHKIIGAVLAVAGPVIPGEDEFKFTNIDRPISISTLKKQLQTEAVYFINDYHAQGMVIPLVQKMPERLHAIVDGQPNPKGVIGVIGPGTGLGVAGLFAPDINPSINPGKTLVIPGEGGNVSIGAKVETIREFLPYMVPALHRFRQQSNDPDKSVTPRLEDMLSGPGLSCTYGGLCLRDGVNVTFPLPVTIAKAAHDGEPRAIEAFGLFFDSLAMGCADAALQYLAVGGIYITGGIVQKNLDLIDKKRFTQIFTNTWHYQDYLATIPVYAVTTETSGLSGAAAYANAL